MVLQQATMQLSQPGGQRVSKLVMLSEYGLAVHKAVDAITGKNDKTWIISHFNSGRSVLKYIKERKDVDKYIERLVNACTSWDFTLQEFDESEWRHDLKIKINIIQKEIMEEKA